MAPGSCPKRLLNLSKRVYECDKVRLVRSMLFHAAESAAEKALPHVPRFRLYNQLNTLGKHCELAAAPGQTFCPWDLKTGKKRINRVTSSLRAPQGAPRIKCVRLRIISSKEKNCLSAARKIRTSGSTKMSPVRERNLRNCIRWRRKPGKTSTTI